MLSCYAHVRLCQGRFSSWTTSVALVHIDLSLQQNHTVERIWPEMNQRVNYPIKTALVQLIDQEALDLDDQLSRYCTSNLSCQVSNVGMQRAVQAWNAHRIPGV